MYIISEAVLSTKLTIMLLLPFLFPQLHEYKSGTPSEKTYFVELWDVGGCTSHENSRSIFYNPVHGEICFSFP